MYAHLQIQPDKTKQSVQEMDINVSVNESESNQVPFHIDITKGKQESDKLSIFNIATTPHDKTVDDSNFNIELGVNDGKRKCNFDVEMSVDIINNKDNFDTLVLFSGDSDFEYLIKNLSKVGKTHYLSIS